MRKLLLVLCMAIIVAPIVHAKGPNCFGPAIAEKATNSSMQKAVADSKQRLSKSCQQPGTQCHFRAIKTENGEIHVAAELAVIDQSTGKCLFPLDAGSLNIYSAEGRFLRSAPGP